MEVELPKRQWHAAAAARLSHNGKAGSDAKFSSVSDCDRGSVKTHRCVLRAMTICDDGSSQAPSSDHLHFSTIIKNMLSSSRRRSAIPQRSQLSAPTVDHSSTTTGSKTLMIAKTKATRVASRSNCSANYLMQHPCDDYQQL